jgi:hypothetical protein
VGVSFGPLVQAVQVAGAWTQVFDAAALTRLDAVTLYNPIGNAACLVTLAIVPSGGSILTPNQITSQNMLAGVTWNPSGLIGQSLNIGDTIWALAGTAGLVNLFIAGTQSS